MFRISGAQSYLKPLLLGEVDAYADGEVQDTQAPNEIPRSWASHSLAFFRLSRSKKGSTPRRFLPHHPIAQISRRSAQDDLLGWGVVVALGRRVVEGADPYRCVRYLFFDRRAVACCRRS